MNLGILALAAVLVIVGRWARKQSLDVPAVVAMFLLALMISGLGMVNKDIARGFALLVLLAVGYEYGPAVLDAVNVNTAAKGGRRLNRNKP